MSGAVGEHVIVNGHGAVDHALEVDVDAAVPCVHRQFVIRDESQWHGPSIVDQDINGTMGRDGRVHRSAHLVEFANVGNNRERRAALCPNGRRSGIDSPGVDIDAGDPGAQRSGPFGDQFAKAVAGSRDDDRFSGYVTGHAALPVRCVITLHAACSPSCCQPIADRQFLHPADE